MKKARDGDTLSLVDTAIEEAELAQFRDQCRRQLRRSLADRIKYGFCLVYKPVLDDAPYRAFSSTAEYRAWCDANLPAYLGYKVVTR